MKNLCGQCTACCTVLGIPSLDKPVYTHCKHECLKGCAIYRDRPKECQDYKCGWLRLNLPKNFRPDILGVIFEVQDSRHGPLVVVREVWQDAFKSKTAELLAIKVAEPINAIIYVVHFDKKRSVICPPNKEHIKEQLKSYVLNKQ